jgi:hypothetical protein
MVSFPSYRQAPTATYFAFIFAGSAATALVWAVATYIVRDERDQVADRVVRDCVLALFCA